MIRDGGTDSIWWDDGANAPLGTLDVVRGLDEASRKPGVVARP